MRSFQRALVEFNSIQIHFIFLQFKLCVYVSSLLNGKLNQVSGRMHYFLSQRKLYILFPIYFLIYFIIVQIQPMYYNLEKRIWFRIIFLPLKESLTLFQVKIFLLYLQLICPSLDLSRIELPESISSILMKILTIPFALVDQF